MPVAQDVAVEDAQEAHLTHYELHRADVHLKDAQVCSVERLLVVRSVRRDAGVTREDTARKRERGIQAHRLDERAAASGHEQFAKDRRDHRQVDVVQRVVPGDGVERFGRERLRCEFPGDELDVEAGVRGEFAGLLDRARRDVDPDDARAACGEEAGCDARAAREVKDTLAGQRLERVEHRGRVGVRARLILGDEVLKACDVLVPERALALADVVHRVDRAPGVAFVPSGRIAGQVFQLPGGCQALGADGAPTRIASPRRARKSTMSTAQQTDTEVGSGRGRTPDSYLVGQPKSGTTALYEILRQHPQIFIPDRKEPRFFAQELFDRDPPRPGGTPKTLAEYRSWFADARDDQRVMDASPWYLWSPTSARRIAEVRPDAQIIIVLREPASLLRSLHLQLVQLYVETETDFRRALELEEPRRRGEHIPRHTYWPAMLMYSDHVRYVDELSRYAEHFPPEQMKILIYDDYRADNTGTVRSLLRFLGVAEDVPLELREANPTVQVRSRHMHEMVHAVSVGHGPVSRAAKAALKAVTPGRWRRQALYSAKRKFVFTEPDRVDDAFVDELRERYRGEVAALGDYLGRDMLALWGYTGSAGPRAP